MIEQVFQEVQSLVTSCMDGYNVCIFAYGQTGSGKTYTMEVNVRGLGKCLDKIIVSPKTNNKMTVMDVTLNYSDL